MAAGDVPDYALAVTPAPPVSPTNAYLYAPLVASSNGATQLVAAVASKHIVVVALAFVCNAAVNVKFQSHVTPTDLTGLFYNAANGGVVLPFNQNGWFQTLSGEALDINLSAAVAVGGTLVYYTV